MNYKNQWHWDNWIAIWKKKVGSVPHSISRTVFKLTRDLIVQYSTVQLLETQAELLSRLACGLHLA